MILDIVAATSFIAAFTMLIIVHRRENKLFKQLRQEQHDLEILARLTAIEDRLIDVKEEVHVQEIEQL